MMWLCGYWMERGFPPERILQLPELERRTWQAIAELNMQQSREQMRDAFLEALSIILPKK